MGIFVMLKQSARVTDMTSHAPPSLPPKMRETKPGRNYLLVYVNQLPTISFIHLLSMVLLVRLEQSFYNDKYSVLYMT